MIKKMLLTLSFVFAVSILPSYTNTSAITGKTLIKAIHCCKKPAKVVDKKQEGLNIEVFPIQLINIQL